MPLGRGCSGGFHREGRRAALGHLLSYFFLSKGLGCPEQSHKDTYNTRVCHVSTPTPTPSHDKTQTKLFREVSVVCRLPSKTLNEVRDGDRSSHSPGNTELSSVANTYSRRSQCSSQSPGTTQACWEACELLIVHHQLKNV